VLLATCSKAAVNRRQVAGAVVITFGGEFVGGRCAFHERLIAVALEHELCRAPNVDHAAQGAQLWAWKTSAQCGQA
jgi:hypothetical protein